MPYELAQSGDGWVVRSKDTGKVHSNHPLTREKAEAQMRALYANVPDAGGGAAKRTRKRLGFRKRPRK